MSRKSQRHKRCRQRAAQRCKNEEARCKNRQRPRGGRPRAERSTHRVEGNSAIAASSGNLTDLEGPALEFDVATGRLWTVAGYPVGIKDGEPTVSMAYQLTVWSDEPGGPTPDLSTVRWELARLGIEPRKRQGVVDDENIAFVELEWEPPISLTRRQGKRLERLVDRWGRNLGAVEVSYGL